MKKQLILVTLLATGMIMDVQAGSWFGRAKAKATLTLQAIKNSAHDVKDKMIQVGREARDSKAVQAVSREVHNLARKTKSLAQRAMNSVRFSTTHAAQAATQEAKKGFESVAHDIKELRNSKPVQDMNAEGHELSNDVHEELKKVEDLATDGVKRLEAALS